MREFAGGLGHSGSPFRQALLHASGLARRYVVAGLLPQSVAAAHLAFVRSRKGEAIARADLTPARVRKIYGSLRPPVMASFDGPNGDAACARRMRSNTPLAALTGLNEPIFVECARALALRVQREGGSSDAVRAEYAFFLCTSRKPTADERQAIVELVASRRQKLADGWLDPRAIATGDPTKLPSLP